MKRKIMKLNFKKIKKDEVKIKDNEKKQDVKIVSETEKKENDDLSKKEDSYMKEIDADVSIDTVSVAKLNAGFLDSTVLRVNCYRIRKNKDMSLNDTASIDDGDEEDSDIPCTQNVHHPRYLKHKPEVDDVTDEDKENEFTEEDEDKECSESEEDDSTLDDDENLVIDENAPESS